MLRHQVQPVFLTAEDAARDEVRLMALAKEIREWTEPEGTPTPLCNWCPRHGNCKFERGGRTVSFKRKWSKRV